MGSGITTTDKMFTVREPAWHNLFPPLPDYPTREEAQKMVHDWEPIEQPVFKKVPVVGDDGTLTEIYEEIEGDHVIERSDNGATLGIVRDTRGLITNDEMWDVVEAAGNVGKDTKIETAGSLLGGQQVWVLLGLEEPLRVKGDPNGDTIAYLAFQNSFTSSGGSFRCQAVNTRIVCMNTSSAADTEAERNGYEFSFRHSKNVGERITEAKSAVAMWREGVTVWQTAMDHMVTEKVTSAQREWFVQNFQPMPRNLITDRVRTNIETARQELRDILVSDTQQGIANTTYGLYQAGIEWAGHFRALKGKTEKARMESYFKRNVVGDPSLRKSTLTLARESVNA